MIKKILLFLFILPLTLLLDLAFYAATRNCPGCGSFWQWVGSEGALSFPIVISLMEYVKRLTEKLEHRIS
ncbi:hypothetical protein FJY90_02500 [Candidatus Gottesmanbacteria bacterium]|nr:hypothetical protein [Candidatus Gottesmanbacteria bacterium]